MARCPSLHWWHRVIGAVVALFAILLAATGIALNHADQLALDQSRVGNRWLAELYGIEPPAVQAAFRAEGREVVLLPPKLYLDQRRVEGEFHQLRGIATLEGWLLIATDAGLLLLDPEDLAYDLLPGPWEWSEIKRLGQRASDRSLFLESGERLYQGALDGDIDSWFEATVEPTIEWSAAVAVDAAAYQHLYLSNILSWERVISDLHSGRILGAGPWLMDLIALGILFLALSGPIQWWRQSRRKPRRRSG